MKLNHGVFALTTATLLALAGTAAAQDQGTMPSEELPLGGQAPSETATTPEPLPPPAQSEVQPLPPPAPYPTSTSDKDVGAQEAGTRWMPASGFGMVIMGGGGITDFTNSAIRTDTSVGGSWDVRFLFGSRSIVGFEASYVGGAQGINGLGLGGDSTLVRNGAEGMLRINAPLHASNTLLEPYIAGGLGWNSYRVTNITSNTAAVSDNDNVMSVPLAAGFAVGYKGFIGDLRYTYRPTYNQDLFNNLVGSELTNWDAGAMLGYEF